MEQIEEQEYDELRVLLQSGGSFYFFFAWIWKQFVCDLQLICFSCPLQVSLLWSKESMLFIRPSYDEQMGFLIYLFISQTLLAKPGRMQSMNIAGES